MEWEGTWRVRLSRLFRESPVSLSGQVSLLPWPPSEPSKGMTDLVSAPIQNRVSITERRVCPQPGTREDSLSSAPVSFLCSSPAKTQPEVRGKGATEVSLQFTEDAGDGAQTRQGTGTHHRTRGNYFFTFLSSFPTTGSLRAGSMCPGHREHSVNIYYTNK